MNVLETRKGEVGKDLAPKSSRSNNEDLALGPQELFDLQSVAHRQDIALCESSRHKLTGSPALNESTSVLGPGLSSTWST